MRPDLPPQSRAFEAAANRLRHARYVLGAGILAILGLGLVASGPAWAVAAAILFLIACAALFGEAGAGRGRESGSAEAPDASGGLSALDLAAAMPDPVLLVDRSGGILHANDAARATFGAIASGMPLQMKFRAPEMQELAAAIEAGAAVPPPPVELVERLPVERVHRVFAARTDGPEGPWVLIFKDQSEVRRIDRMRADFIANASHELRTPLASIAGFVETLRGPAKDDPAAREHFLEIMHAQTTRMARLIDDLLSLSRLEMKAFLNPGDRAEIVRVVREVMDSLAHQAREAGVAFEYVGPEGGIEINGDEDELFQVFENLLENACKYGGSGGKVVVTVEPASPATEGEVRVTVRDFGPGIASEHIPRITERFYRVDVEDSRARKGTGLGLSIVKHILSRHDARLTIRSRLGEGAAFTVGFPQEG